MLYSVNPCVKIPKRTAKNIHAITLFVFIQKETP